MPSFFLKNTKNGFLVTSHKVNPDFYQSKFDSPPMIWLHKDVEFKNGIKRNMKWKVELKLGFVACDDPELLEYQFGDELPITITDNPINTIDDLKTNTKKLLILFWANPDRE